MTNLRSVSLKARILFLFRYPAAHAVYLYFYRRPLHHPLYGKTARRRLQQPALRNLRYHAGSSVESDADLRADSRQRSDTGHAASLLFSFLAV